MRSCSNSTAGWKRGPSQRRKCPASSLKKRGFAGTPAYLGAVEHVASSGARTTLASAFRFVANQGDAWSSVTNGLERLLEGYRLAEGELDEALRAFPLNVASKIGQRTAELHCALAGSADHQAFSPERVTRSDIQRWVKDTRNSADTTFAALQKASSHAWGEATEQAVRLLMDQRSKVDALLDSYASIEPSGFKMRHHGDYHLGQLLMVKDDILIIDFEGEPHRSLEERRAKVSPLRDLAGMLRSFDYAAWAALDKLAARGIQLTEERRSLAFRWRDEASRDCLAAYRAATEPSSISSGTQAVAEKLLSTFLLEKALYEIRYELGSRPAWLSIPVRGALDLLARAEAQQ